ncbi:MAG: hypothetical protein JNM55_21215 [Anaerolineales bacterium]|nr:hypothetical protein [Anaerolineales bacterium]
MNNLNRQQAVDPAVADLLSDMDRKKRLSSLPRAMQKKARKDAARHKVGLDFPPALHEELRQVADKEKISISSLTAFFAKRGLDEYKAGQIDLVPYMRISRSARFEFVLSLEKVRD